jgi:hypothetical protein
MARERLRGRASTVMWGEVALQQSAGSIKALTSASVRGLICLLPVSV